jgi:hypothetical protein
MRLSPYDPEDLFEATEVTLVSPLRVGNRDDLAWARVDPPIRLMDKDRHVIALGTRHAGDSLWDLSKGGSPVHVYVLLANGDGSELGPDLTADIVTIAAWGLLHEV